MDAQNGTVSVRDPSTQQCRQTRPRSRGSADHGWKVRVDLACDVALPAACDLTDGLSVGGAFRDVGPCATLCVRRWTCGRARSGSATDTPPTSSPPSSPAPAADQPQSGLIGERGISRADIPAGRLCSRRRRHRRCAEVGGGQRARRITVRRRHLRRGLHRCRPDDPQHRGVVRSDRRGARSEHGDRQPQLRCDIIYDDIDGVAGRCAGSPGASDEQVSRCLQQTRRKDSP